MWVPDLVQKRLHSTSPVVLRVYLVKLGQRNQEAQGIGEAQENPGEVALAPWKVRDKGPWRQFQGVTLPVAGPVGPLGLRSCVPEREEGEGKAGACSREGECRRTCTLFEGF